MLKQRDEEVARDQEQPTAEADAAENHEHPRDYGYREQDYGGEPTYDDYNATLPPDNAGSTPADRSAA